jgi:hypothetical protein
MSMRRRILEDMFVIDISRYGLIVEDMSSVFIEYRKTVMAICVARAGGTSARAVRVWGIHLPCILGLSRKTGLEAPVLFCIFFLCGNTYLCVSRVGCFLYMCMFACIFVYLLLTYWILDDY